MTAYGAFILVGVIASTLGISFIVTAFRMVSYKSSPVYAVFWAGLIFLLTAALFFFAAHAYYPE